MGGRARSAPAGDGGSPAENGVDLALPGLAEVYAAYVRATAGLLEQPGALEAELWLSAQLGTLRSAAPHAQGYRLALTDLVRVMADAATPGAVAFLRVFAAVGPGALRRAAGRAADMCVAGGSPEPMWSASPGDLRCRDVFSVQDGTLAGEQIVAEFRYRDGSGRHALVVRLDHGRPVEVVVVGDLTGMMATLNKAAAAEECVLMRLGRATAAERLRAAFAPPALPAEEPAAEDRRDGGKGAGGPEWFARLPIALHRIDVLSRESRAARD